MDQLAQPADQRPHQLRARSARSPGGSRSARRPSPPAPRSRDRRPPRPPRPPRAARRSRPGPPPAGSDQLDEPLEGSPPAPPGRALSAARASAASARPAPRRPRPGTRPCWRSACRRRCARRRQSSISRRPSSPRSPSPRRRRRPRRRAARAGFAPPPQRGVPLPGCQLALQFRGPPPRRADVCVGTAQSCTCLARSHQGPPRACQKRRVPPGARRVCRSADQLDGCLGSLFTAKPTPASGRPSSCHFGNCLSLHCPCLEKRSFRGCGRAFQGTTPLSITAWLTRLSSRCPVASQLYIDNLQKTLLAISRKSALLSTIAGSGGQGTSTIGLCTGDLAAKATS